MFSFLLKHLLVSIIISSLNNGLFRTVLFDFQIFNIFQISFISEKRLFDSPVAYPQIKKDPVSADLDIETVSGRSRSQRQYPDIAHKTIITRKKPLFLEVFNRQRAWFTRRAMLADEVLNFWVRDGTRCDHFSIVTGSRGFVPSKLNNTTSRL